MSETLACDSCLMTRAMPASKGAAEAAQRYLIPKGALRVQVPKYHGIRASIGMEFGIEYLCIWVPGPCRVHGLVPG